MTGNVSVTLVPAVVGRAPVLEVVGKLVGVKVNVVLGVRGVRLSLDCSDGLSSRQEVNESVGDGQGSASSPVCRVVEASSGDSSAL